MGRSTSLSLVLVLCASCGGSEGGRRDVRARQQDGALELVVATMTSEVQTGARSARLTREDVLDACGDVVSANASAAAVARRLQLSDDPARLQAVVRVLELIRPDPIPEAGKLRRMLAESPRPVRLELARAAERWEELAAVLVKELEAGVLVDDAQLAMRALGALLNAKLAGVSSRRAEEVLMHAIESRDNGTQYMALCHLDDPRVDIDVFVPSLARAEVVGDPLLSREVFALLVRARGMDKTWLEPVVDAYLKNTDHVLLAYMGLIARRSGALLAEILPSRVAAADERQLRAVSALALRGRIACGAVTEALAARAPDCSTYTRLAIGECLYGCCGDAGLLWVALEECARAEEGLMGLEATEVLKHHPGLASDAGRYRSLLDTLSLSTESIVREAAAALRAR